MAGIYLPYQILQFRYKNCLIIKELEFKNFVSRYVITLHNVCVTSNELEFYVLQAIFQCMFLRIVNLFFTFLILFSCSTAYTVWRPMVITFLLELLNNILPRPFNINNNINRRMVSAWPFFDLPIKTWYIKDTSRYLKRHLQVGHSTNK